MRDEKLPIPCDAEIALTALTMASEGKTRQQISDSLGISVSTLVRRINADPALKKAYETARYDASQVLLDKLITIPESEPDTRRARVICDNVERYLRLAYPKRFGPKLDVTVTAINLSDAIARGRQRAGVVIEGSVVSPHALEHVAEGK